MKLLLLVNTLTLYDFTIYFLLIFLLCTLIYMNARSRNVLKTPQTPPNQSLLKAQNIENIVHDIKTPIQLIHHVLKTINCKDEQSREILHIGLKHTKALNEEVDSILHNLKQDQILYTIVNEEVLLLPFFNDFLAMYAFNLMDKSLTLEFNHNLTDKTKVSIDIKKITRILTNYLDNVVYYSPEQGRIKLSIVAKLQTLSFKVVNKGIHIDPMHIHLAFNRYYNSEINGIGDGINLAIVKELSDLLNGQVSLTCKQGKTIFSLSFNTNIVLVGIKTHTRTYPIRPTNTKSLSNKEQYRILIVDDSKLMLNFYQRILSKYYNCDFANDGLEALKKIKEHTYHCIITDIIMPNCDGYELSKRIRSVDFYRQIPIIFVSGIASTDHKKDLERVGVQDIIVKPISIKELHTRIYNLIHNYNLRLSHIDTIHKQPPYNSEEDEELLKRILKSIHKNLSNPGFKVSDLATSIFYSERQLARKTNLLTGLSPSKLILEIRLCKAYTLLSECHQIKIAEVQEEVGIKSTAYFHKQFKRRFGITPGSVQPNTH